MTEPSVKHGTFVVERHYPVPPATVFEAWTDAAAKAVWMDDPDFKSDGTPYQLDFRVGGHERFGGLSLDGEPYRYDALYYDIVPGERIVYSYEMYAGQDRTSVSLTTVEIVPDAAGTRLTYTEQGAFLHGEEESGDREGGVTAMLDGLGAYLASSASLEATREATR
jgi:uncharacterized protein YndB with AHSA1/START domain